MKGVARVAVFDDCDLDGNGGGFACETHCTGLRVRSVNRLRRRFVIEENAVMIAYEIHVGTSKTTSAADTQSASPDHRGGVRRPSISSTTIWMPSHRAPNDTMPLVAPPSGPQARCARPQ